MISRSKQHTDGSAGSRFGWAGSGAQLRLMLYTVTYLWRPQYDTCLVVTCNEEKFLNYLKERPWDIGFILQDHLMSFMAGAVVLKGNSFRFVISSEESTINLKTVI